MTDYKTWTDADLAAARDAIATVWAPGVYGWKLDTTGQTTTKPPGGNA